MINYLKNKICKKDRNAVLSVDQVTLKTLQEQIKQLELFMKKYQMLTDNKIKKLSEQISNLENKKDV